MNIRNSKIRIDAAWKGLKHALSFEGPSPPSHYLGIDTDITYDRWHHFRVLCTARNQQSHGLLKYDSHSILPLLYLKNRFFLKVNLHACFFHLVKSFSSLEVLFGPISGISTRTMQPRQMSTGRCVRLKQWQKKKTAFRSSDLQAFFESFSTHTIKTVAIFYVGPITSTLSCTT